MIKQCLSSNRSGLVRIYKGKRGDLKLVKTSHNDILPDSNLILAKLMVNEVSAKIDNIVANDNVSELAIAIITTKTLIPEDPSVEYQALFNEASFNGTLTKLYLRASDADLTFSEVLGLNVSKNDTEQLLVTWTITFN